MNTAPYDAIFFDMDGTLLPIEVRDFLIPYYQLLEAAALRSGYDAPAMRDAVNAGIFGMYDHPETETNAVAFWRVFNERYFGTATPAEADAKRIFNFFQDFYAHDFGKAGEGVVPNPAAVQAVETLRDKGYPLYLTTMPMFPYDAIDWRMQWANVPINYFARITTFDNSTSVKPHVGYYRENIVLTAAASERILMVGNNTSDDLSCLETGMDAYLVTDVLINENEFDLNTVKHGSLADFAAWVETLPPCTSSEALNWRSRADELRIGDETMGMRI